MLVTKPSICRVCHAQCPVLVDVEDGRAVRLTGIKDNPIYHGYACGKGRAMPDYHYMEQRLLTSMKRQPDGSHAPIASADAIDEIAAKLGQILKKHGPRSIAIYNGTHGYNNFMSTAFGFGWMEALESPMIFTSVTIDQPGKAVSGALHGTWLAGCTSMDRADVWLTVGANPVISMLGPVNPAHALTRNQKRGMKFVVIDPRRTEAARRADVFLQPRPGHDPTILAGMLRIILTEGLQDKDFLNDSVRGLDALIAAVEPFNTEFASQRADVPADLIAEAARTYAAGKSGVVGVGTGPNMAGHGNLTEYLSRVLMTVCGHWLQAGDTIPNPGVLIHRLPALAQAVDPSPAWGFGEKIRVRGLSDTAAGMPTGALADEILLKGEGQVKALISIGGNPMMAWPDQLKTYEAMQKLDLLVCLDPLMSATARLAHYVVATKTHLEVIGLTALQEACGAYIGWGYWAPYGQYCEAAVEPPAGSDLIEDWELFYGTARRMGLDLQLKPFSWLFYPEEQAKRAVALDMNQQPSTESLYEFLFQDSPVPLSELKKFPEGAIFEVPDMLVGAKQPGHEGRLDVGSEPMMGELDEISVHDHDARHSEFAFRLISRRLADIVNSSWRPNPITTRRWPYNPTFMNPRDMKSLGLAAGDEVEIVSRRAAIKGIVESAPDVRPGVISMPHCWGDNPGMDDSAAVLGANTGRLTPNDYDYDPHTGIPRMSGIPVNVRARPQTS